MGMAMEYSQVDGQKEKNNCNKGGPEYGSSY